MEKIRRKRTNEDLTGQTFNRWYVEKQLDERLRNGSIFYQCKCSCGNQSSVESSALRKGRSKSCGCLQLEWATKHSMWNCPEYKTWVSMHQRCNNPNHTSYKDYGARGIKICDRWRNSFQHFYDDMGKRPSPNHTIDREDVNGNYELSNCRWATKKEQGRNKTNSRFFTYKGIKRCASEWCELYGMANSTFHNRIIKGWSIEKTLETKIRFKSK